MKGASQYSPACKRVKYPPSVTVSAKACIALFRSPSISLWCDHVIVTPEARRTAVFSRGTEKGFNGSIPVGGQQQPNSGVGARLL